LSARDLETAPQRRTAGPVSRPGAQRQDLPTPDHQGPGDHSRSG